MAEGRQAEAEALYRVDVAAERAQGGDRHPNTLAALADLAINLCGSYTDEKGFDFTRIKSKAG